MIQPTDILFNFHWKALRRAHPMNTDIGLLLVRRVTKVIMSDLLSTISWKHTETDVEKFLLILLQIYSEISKTMIEENGLIFYLLHITMLNLSEQCTTFDSHGKHRFGVLTFSIQPFRSMKRTWSKSTGAVQIWDTLSCSWMYRRGIWAYLTKILHRTL